MEWRGYSLPIDFLLIKDVSKKIKKFKHLKKRGECLNGRNADNESKRSRQITDN